MLLNDRDIIVCIFQRGAADGLNAVVPYGDTFYATHRSTIAVPAPMMPNGADDLDGFFGLHPALAPLRPIYDAGDLALVHATGVPHGSRSHFAAQAYVERGTAVQSGPTDGWLGRHLSLSPAASGSAFRAVSISGNVALSLLGADEPLAISNLNEFGFDQEIIDSGYPQILTDLYRAILPHAGHAQAALSALDELHAANLPALTPENGAVYPSTALGNNLLQAGQLIKSNLPVEVICLDSDGWDHHENLPIYINQSLTDLAGALSAFYTDMGARMQGVTVIVHTEFGRRVAENASLGTDHGTGSLAYLMGANVNGGQVWSDWPGLAPANLEMGEDLRITTDLRSVCSELLSKRLVGTSLGAVFPGFIDNSPTSLFSI